jgi:glycosyltransferase EpsE
MNEQLVSIIMPAYNVENFIEEAIQSILNQTYTNFELLICDDGSTDQTWQIINQFDDERILKFRNKVNIGNLKTTNFLFNEVKGDFIAVLDADDISDSKRIEEQIIFLNDNIEYGIVGSQFEIIDEQGESLYCGLLPMKDPDIKDKMSKEVIPILYGSILIRTDLVRKIGGFRIFFNRKGFADLDWLARAAELTKVYNLNIPLYKYRKHFDSFTNSQVSTNKNKMIFEMHLLIIESHKQRLMNGSDFIDLLDKKKIKLFLSEYYFKVAENEYWMGKKKKAIILLLITLKYKFVNLKVFRAILFMLRN